MSSQGRKSSTAGSGFFDRGSRRRNRFRTRVFAPTFGYLEDPATGSGSAALAYYLYSSGRWSGDLFSIEQGPERDCPNLIKVFYDKEQGRVVFGGRADCRIAGRYFLTE